MFEGVIGKEEEQSFKTVRVTKQEHWVKIYEQCYWKKNAGRKNELIT